MWNYEKRLQYPVKITQTNPKIAQISPVSASTLILLDTYSARFPCLLPVLVFCPALQ